MASFRSKESKIPLRVDSKLKNVSKIPLKVETKPKITFSTGAQLKTTSAVGKKKDPIYPDRNKKSLKEIPKKELNPLNSHLKSKGKENRLQPSGKSYQSKVNNNRTPRDIASNNRIANSKAFSQALKDGNKISKGVSKKTKAVEVKTCSLERKTSEIIVTDNGDIFKTHTEKKPLNYSNHPSQQDIEFVADDRMRNLILSNKELTPSILKSCSNIKTPFVMERPSLYNRPMSVIKSSVDPYKQALADIANSNLAAEGRRVSEMQKNRLYTSPLQNRNSLYQRASIFAGDPYKEVLKSLAELRMHRKIESCKKVTFKLSSEDRTLETECCYENDGKKSVKEIQPKLTDLNSKCSDSNILLTSGDSHSKVAVHLPSKPNKEVTQCTGSNIHLTTEFERNSILTTISNPLKAVDSPSKANEIFVSRQFKDAEEHENLFFNNNTNLSTFSSMKTVTNNKKAVCEFSPMSCQDQKSSRNAAIISHEIKNSILKTANPFLNPVRNSEVRHSLFSKQSGCVLDQMNPKIFTPQPVSFYPRTELPESFSPEFLSRRTTDILSFAPINTPSVLKNLSKPEEGSPICKKLEFIDSPKETYKDPRESCFKNQTFDLQNIMTQQKILDQLAHQECSIFMHEATFPCEIRSHLQNPIAQILNNGDEMHFVPVSLLRLS